MTPHNSHRCCRIYRETVNIERSRYLPGRRAGKYRETPVNIERDFSASFYAPSFPISSIFVFFFVFSGVPLPHGEKLRTFEAEVTCPDVERAQKNHENKLWLTLTTDNFSFNLRRSKGEYNTGCIPNCN